MISIKSKFLTDRLLNFFNLAVGLVGIAYSFYGLFKAGIGWDSAYNTRASIQTRSLESGVDLQGAYEFVPLISEFYGILIFQVSDALNHFFSGNESFMLDTDPNTYIWQGAVNIFLALIASTLFSYSIYSTTNSAKHALFGWAMLNTLPIWVGTTHINFKDGPFAAGLTVVSSALIIILFRRITIDKEYLFFIALGVGTLITVGSRPGGVLVLGFLVLASQVIFFLYNLICNQLNKKIFYKLIILNITVLISIGLLKFLHPIARINLFQWLYDSTTLASEFPHNMPQRFAGINASSLELPWWYAPAWFVAQTPLTIIIIFLGIFVFLTIFKGFKSIKGFFKESFFSFPLMLQGFVIPFIIVASGAIIYDAVRHLFFVWPSLVILLVLLIKTLEQNLIQVTSKKLIITNLLIFLIIFFNLFATARWAPYSYAFINPIAGYSKEQRNWELDYWGVTAREGVTLLREKYELDPIYVMPDGSSSVPYGGIGLSRLEDLEISTPIGLYVFIRWNHKIVPEKCDILFEIKRDRQTLGMGGVCPALNSSAN